MADPADIRSETCTNLSILLDLLIRNIKPGDVISFIATRKQLVTIDEVLPAHGITVNSKEQNEDLLVTIAKL